MNGDSYRLKQSTGRRQAATIDAAKQNQATVETGDQADASQVDPATV
ncbi:Uncharacterised protein [Mycobacterium tuberculosis]|nr:Uncharacterised protein [Mycobacterium tuberculosis]